MSRRTLRSRNDLIYFMSNSLVKHLINIDDESNLQLPPKIAKERTNLYDRLQRLVEQYLNCFINTCEDASSFMDKCDPVLYKALSEAEYGLYADSLISKLSEFSSEPLQQQEYDYTALQRNVLNSYTSVLAELRTQSLFYGG